MNPKETLSKDSARRVVVTGMGAIAPLGHSAEENWQGMLAGKSGIRTISLFDASQFPTQIAGEVRGFNAAALVDRDPALLDATRSTLFAIHAAEEALAQSGLDFSRTDPGRCGIYFGAGDSGIDFEPFVECIADSLGQNGEVIDKARYLAASSEKMNGLRELETQPFMTAVHLARRFGISGPVSTCLTACAASSQAIGEGAEWIRRGDADVVMSGGSHSMIYPLGIAGFSLLTALSTRNDAPEKASRPFDKKRDGFILAEGAGVLILEERQHALRRGAKVFGEIAGYGCTSDAYRLTDMDPEGRGAMRAMVMAMNKAGFSHEQIDYINAHGTSTRINDVIETRAIKSAMRESAARVPVSSIKSMLGHMIAAAGVLEIIACLLAIRDSVLPPTINYEERDPECDLDYIPNHKRGACVRHVLSNSFGFGGQNICLAVKKHEA